MKTTFWSGLLFFTVLNLSAQLNDATNQMIGATPPRNTAYAVVQNDANSRNWERTTYDQSPSGETVPHVHGYTEVASGLNYQKHGQWVESKEEIDVLPQGGGA